MLALYGHPFSSYTWKVLIALNANGTEFEFRQVDSDHPEHAEVLRMAGPQGKMPVLADGDNLIFESTSIIEYVANRHPGGELLIPLDPDAAIGMRMLDRVFDHYVMGNAEAVIKEHIRNPGAPDQTRIAEAKERLRKSYAWLEGWLEYHRAGGQITLIECSAAPSLYYADWIEPIGDGHPRLKAWLAHLCALDPVAICIDAARPYQDEFRKGALGWI